MKPIKLKKPRNKDDRSEINWQLLLIYAKYVAEITMIIGLFIFLFLITKRAGIV